jgi:nucleoside-diphosphate-sugar epimerase
MWRDPRRATERGVKRVSSGIIVTDAKATSSPSGTGSTPKCIRLALVTGATGAVGGRLVEALSREWAVRSLVRGGAESLPGEVVPGDLSEIASLERACAGADTVFHLAALLHIVNPGADLESEYARVNVEGTRTLVRAAERAGVRRFVHFSTIAVYGPSSTTTDEATSTAPETIYARTKLESERIVLESAIPEPVVLRLAAVYGSHLKGNYRRLVQSLCAGRFVGIGKGTNRRTLVHEQDVARAAVLAATHEAAPHEVFNVTDGATHEVSSILEAISAALGRRVPRLHIPPPLVGGALSIASAGQRLLGRNPTLGPWLLEKYLEDVHVSGEKLHRILGYAPSMSLEEGWRETVDGMRARGEIPARCSFLGRIR